MRVEVQRADGLRLAAEAEKHDDVEKLLVLARGHLDGRSEKEAALEKKVADTQAWGEREIARLNEALQLSEKQRADMAELVASAIPIKKLLADIRPNLTTGTALAQAADALLG